MRSQAVDDLGQSVELLNTEVLAFGRSETDLSWKEFAAIKAQCVSAEGGGRNWSSEKGIVIAVGALILVFSAGATFVSTAPLVIAAVSIWQAWVARFSLDYIPNGTRIRVFLDHGRCARCGYRIEAIAGELVVCSECGAGWRKRTHM